MCASGDVARRRTWAVRLLLTALVFSAGFSRLRGLGLYEDDYNMIVPGLAPLPAADWVAFLEDCFRRWPNGRPLGFFLGPLLTRLAVAVGGLPGAFVLGGAIASANAALFHGLVERAGGPRLALLAGLAFALYPADSTRALLTHAFVLQPALLLFLVATWAWFTGRRWACPLLLGASALCYESLLPLFLAVPLLARRPGEPLLSRPLVTSGALTVAVGAALLLLRRGLGEAKALGLDPPLLLVKKVALGAVLGPAVSVGSYAWAPAELLSASLDAAGVCVVGALALLLPLALSRVTPRRGAVSTARSRALLPAAAALLVLGYALAFTHFPPDARAGRETRMHLGAQVGAALAFGCLSLEALALAARAGRGALWAIGLGVHAALLAGYQQTVQAEYVRSWSEQRRFWGQVTRLCPDRAEGTMIFAVLPPTGGHHILTHSWADPLVLMKTDRAPAAWKGWPPRLFVLDATRPMALQREGEALRWLVPIGVWLPHWETLPQGNVIVLRSDERGDLWRQEGTLATPQGEVRLKPRGGSTPLEPGPARAVLLGEGGP